MLLTKSLDLQLLQHIFLQSRYLLFLQAIIKSGYVLKNTMHGQ